MSQRRKVIQLEPVRSSSVDPPPPSMDGTSTTSSVDGPSTTSSALANDSAEIAAEKPKNNALMGLIGLRLIHD